MKEENLSLFHSFIFILYNTHGLDAELFEHLDELLVEWLVGTDGLGEWHIYHLVVLDANHHVTLTLLECLDCTYTCTAGKDTVTSRRTTATLQVTEDRYTHIVAGELVLDTLCIVEGTALW